MTIDFHTCTSLFSNCGSRRLVAFCCPTATPAANTEPMTGDCADPFDGHLYAPNRLAALRPAMPSRSAGDTGNRLTASSIFGMLPI